METFSCLQLAINSMQKGGNMPCILNAANEVAVAAFLENRIRFNGIPKLIATTMERASYIKEPTFEDYVQTDKESRILASEAI